MALGCPLGHHGEVVGLGASLRSRRLLVALLAFGVLVVGLLPALAPVVSAASVEWNVAKVRGPRTDSGVTIAVVDTGVDGSHPAFGGRVLSQISISPGGGDDNGHGTHVAGTAAGGVIDCADGLTDGPSAIGVAPNVRILPVRVLDAEGSGTVSDVAEGIRRAADRGVEVINLSLGTDLGEITGPSGTFVDAIEYAWQQGSIPVLAAGNGDLVGGILGSGYGDIDAVVVTATTRDDRKPGYATGVGGNTKWGIAAPGGDNSREAGRDVLSAWPGRACGLSAGTSMAAPHVSGALAILRAKGLSKEQAVQRLLDTATPIAPSSTYGAGLVNLERAVTGLGQDPAPAPTTPAPTTPTTTPTTTAGTAAPGPPSTAPGSAPSGTQSPTPTTGSGDAGPSDEDDSSDPTSTTAGSTPPADEGGDTDPDPSGDDETAADLTVEVEDGGQAGAPLVAAAGLAALGAWALVGRAALRLRG